MSSANRRPSKAVQDISAGGVIVRWERGQAEVVLVGRAHPARWTLPKGTPLAEETIEQAALREVREETGLQARILEPLGDIQYWFTVRGVQHHKTVHFFLMEAVAGATADHDWEHDYVEWAPAQEALDRISYPNEAAMVERAVERSQQRGQPSGGAPGEAPAFHPRQG